MNILKNLFGQSAKSDEDPAHSSDLRAVEAALAGVEPAQAKLLSGFALLLARVAHIDFNVSESEKKRIQEMLIRYSHLNEQQAQTVLTIALDRAARHSVEEHIVIRQINAVADRERRKDIIRALFHVASDADITEKESEEIFVIAKALLFSRQEYIELRSEFREHLTILKNMPR